MSGEPTSKRVKLSSASQCKVVTRSSHLRNVVSSVPTELWVKILGHLSNVEVSMAGAVCTRLYDISKHSSLWEKLEFDVKMINENYEAVQNFIDRSVNVKEIRLTNEGNRAINSMTLVDLIVRARKTLKVLILSPEIELKNKDMKKFKCLDKLEVLNVALDRIGHTSVKAISKLKDLREFRPIRDFNLYYVFTTEDSKLNFLFGKLKNLEVVDLSYIRLTQDTLKTLALNNPRLQTVILECSFLDTIISLTDLTKNCPNLKHLNLRLCDVISDYDINALVHAKKLVHLDVSRSDDLTSDMVINISKNCPQLKHLNIFDCDNIQDDAIKALAKNCPNLEYLDMDGCPNVSEGAFEELVMACKNLRFISAYNVSPTFKKRIGKDRPDLEIDSL